MKLKLLFLCLPVFVFSQGYTSYFTGNPVNVNPTPSMGICLMGGATENDNAMKWLLEKANGGDVLVLRATGTNGYNNYLYSQLGISVNSVETIVITSAAGATNPYVLGKVANAEMIWFAGGDQSQYVNYFKDNAMETELNNFINIKQGPIGGTSAGMAILCGNYFSALNGSITSAEALANPYNVKVTLGNNDFLNLPFLNNVTNDTHFNNPDRKGRITTFLARKSVDNQQRSFGISCNEYTAVCIDATGKAKIFGDYPNYQEFAYFLQANCQTTFLPENCTSGSPLTWSRGGEAVKVYKVAGTQTGANFFEMSNWQTASGGTWEHWTANNGVFTTGIGTAPACALETSMFSEKMITLYPNPTNDFLYIDGLEVTKLTIFDTRGMKVLEQKSNVNKVDVSKLSSGIYMIEIKKNDTVFYKKISKL
jgi:cyanophycinase-like exopeptidase